MTAKQIKLFKKDIEEICERFGLQEFTIVATSKIENEIEVYHHCKTDIGSKSVVDRIATINSTTLMSCTAIQKTTKP